MQASSLPNTPSILTPIYSRQLDNNNFLNIPSIVTSPSIPTSVSESFLFNYQQEQLNSPISQAISAPVTPTSSVTPGFSHPPRRGKGNQNGSSSSNDVKSNGSKSNSNLAHIPCKFFKSGACTAGKNCVFSHSKDPPSDNYVCKYFLKGNCKFGSKCALSHTLPNERKSSSNGRNGTKNANGSRNSISNSMIPEIRSPTMLPQDLNDFHPLNSPGIPPFTRIPISPSSEYANNRQFSQLTASLNDPSAFADENHTAPRLRNINTNFNNDHLSAPININGPQRRSLPDIFHLGGPMNNNNHHNHNHNHNYNNSNNNNNTAESFGTSPFHNPGSKSIFLPLSYVSDSGMLSPTTNPHQHLHSIPESLHDYSHHEDTILDDFTTYEYEEFLPSSLTDLLNPTELQRRQSRQEEIAEISPRRLFNGSSMLHPMQNIDGQHLNYYNSHVDPTHIHFAGRSLPHGIGTGLAANYMNHNEGQQVNNAYGGFGFHSGASMRNNTGYGEDWNDQLSPLSPLHPIHNQNPHHFNHNNNPGYSSDNHGPYSGTPAINIPLPHEVHQTDTNSPLYPSFGIIGRPNVNINGNGNKSGRSATPPDPFSPFGPDDDLLVFFNMEVDKNDQVSTEVSSSKSSEQPKTPLSYSAITKTGLKNSGATPGLSIDSRRYEPVC